MKEKLKRLLRSVRYEVESENMKSPTEKTKWLMGLNELEIEAIADAILNKYKLIKR